MPLTNWGLRNYWHQPGSYWGEAVEVDLSNLHYWCNDKFYPLMHDTHRYMVLMGGGGSGKSHFLCAEDSVSDAG